MSHKTKSLVASLALVVMGTLGTVGTAVAADAKSPISLKRGDGGGWCC